MVRMKRAFAIALVTLALPAAAAAQQRAPAPATSAQQAQAPNEQQMQQWMTELQQIHGKLEAIQAKAAEDPQLRAAQESLGTEIRTAMEKADPTLPTSMQRVQTLESEAVQAQQAGDQAKLEQLAREAQTIQARFMEAQAKAFQQPEIATRLEAFQTRLESRMVEVDPAASGLIQRFKELEGKLATAMQAPRR